MTALTAIFGCYRRRLGRQIGSETQRPLAIVVVGGHDYDHADGQPDSRLYSFYGHRQPPEGAGVSH